MTTTAVKERPIPFNGKMVRAILDGRKTQTRQIVKLPQDECGEWRSVVLGGGTAHYSDGNPAPETLCLANCKSGYCIGSPYEVGMRLWVRETWGLAGSVPILSFRADKSGFTLERFENQYRFRNRFAMWCDERAQYPDGGGWRPSIHMPRWASRLTLELTDVRVERVQDISLADVAAEGVPPNNEQGWDSTDGFAELWDKVNGRGSWRKNEWVWVLAFERLEAQ